MEKKREHFFSLSKDAGDFVVEPVKRSSGKGGQKANKTSSGCRIYHPKSGAQALCYEERSFTVNRGRAFKRLCESKQFQNWLRLEISRRQGDLIDIETKVERAMAQVRIDVKDRDGRWVEAHDVDFTEGEES